MSLIHEAGQWIHKTDFHTNQNALLKGCSLQIPIWVTTHSLYFECCSSKYFQKSPPLSVVHEFLLCKVGSTKDKPLLAYATEIWGLLARMTPPPKKKNQFFKNTIDRKHSGEAEKMETGMHRRKHIYPISIWLLPRFE